MRDFNLSRRSGHGFCLLLGSGPVARATPYLKAPSVSVPTDHDWMPLFEFTCHSGRTNC
jgi:hypothetical protein